jgi:hypothetical protein
MRKQADYIYKLLQIKSRKKAIPHETTKRIKLKTDPNPARKKGSPEGSLMRMLSARKDREEIALCATKSATTAKRSGKSSDEDEERRKQAEDETGRDPPRK